MKAIIFEQYGSPDVLQLKEIEKTHPKDDSILIKVHAASGNPLDWHRMRGEPFLVRTDEGFRKPKNSRIGADVAGVVEAVGKDVTQLKVGDEVFGNVVGSFAEYVCAKEKFAWLKPQNSSFEEAASFPVVAFTAIQGLRDAGNIQKGQRVLVNGASGGVGTFAVQYAKAMGAEVTGVCSTGNLELVRSIGADHVIDYTQQDFTRLGQHFDLIYDAVGNRSVSDYQRALRPEGKCVIAGFTSLSRIFQYLIIGAWVSRGKGKKVGMMPTASPNQEDLKLTKELVENGKVKPVIDRCYPLSQTAEAIRYLETGRARGKVVITVA